MPGQSAQPLSLATEDCEARIRALVRAPFDDFLVFLSKVSAQSSASLRNSDDKSAGAAAANQSWQAGISRESSTSVPAAAAASVAKTTAVNSSIPSAAQASDSAATATATVTVSVDVPSGWEVTAGDVYGTGVMPHMLVSLTAPKGCARAFQQQATAEVEAAAATTAVTHADG